MYLFAWFLFIFFVLFEVEQFYGKLPRIEKYGGLSKIQVLGNLGEA